METTYGVLYMQGHWIAVLFEVGPDFPWDDDNQPPCRVLSTTEYDTPDEALAVAELIMQGD